MADTGISGKLTDGSGIGQFTASKVFKDLVVDALKSSAAALVAVNIVALPQNTAQTMIAATAIVGAVVSALYRAVLKWGES
jgi:hypothetical protein